jgi:type VI secretion system protein ImpL
VFAFLKRAVLLLIGLLLIALFVWFAGPYFAFADYRPLETETSRLIGIGLIVACWVVWRLVKWLSANRASEKLGAVLKQARPEKERPSAEAAKLRERFEEAVATLTARRRAGHGLYDLPWYVFIGAPGSGKTTALVNSGLKFPLEQRVGKAAVRGVGGTRNCDWWFTDEAVFLDTAGRYTTQDSDPASDSEGWREFLALLGKYRKRRPVNGIVLTISAEDLMVQGTAGLEEHVEAAQRRLNEFTRELSVQLPVYVMVTKCDKVAGFTEYFDDLVQEERTQVWGVTFPYEQTLGGDAPDGFPAEFDALMARLNARVFERLEEERGARRRATVFAFPQQMAALRDPLTQFVADVFSSTHFDKRILLRGVYLTSGTQDGTQIDRLMGAIGRRFGIAPEAVASPAGRGKAYFVERLLKDVVIAESGLAGVNRRLELQKAGWQLGAYAAVALVVALGLTAWSVSYASNRAYIGQVATDVERLGRVPIPPGGASVEALSPRLNAVRAVADSANRYRDDVPWGMRWGLYQGASVGDAARDAYRRELDSLLLPRLAARVRQRVVDYGSEPEKLYFYLKAYLMLGDPRHFDRKYLQSLADLEWKKPESVPGTGVTPATHVRSLLEIADTLRPVAVDQTLVEQARSSIRETSIPRIMYAQLQRSHGGESAGALHLEITAVGIEQVLRRKSGRRLSEPVPSLYTKKVFKETTGAGMIQLVNQFAADRWVWDPAAVSDASWAKLTAQVTDLYERDYIRYWDDLLNDLEIVPSSTVDQYTRVLGILVGRTSPLHSVLMIVVENTDPAAPSSEAASGGSLPFGTKIVEGAKSALGAVQEKVTGTPSAGTLITQHFQAIRQFMNGAPAPYEGMVDQIRKIRDQLGKLGIQAGGASPLKTLSDPGFLDLRRTLRQDSTNLPSPLNALADQIARATGGSVGKDATTELEHLYGEEVVSECRVLVDGRYPFAYGDETSDMSFGEFGHVFGYEGLFDKFFIDHLAPLVDRVQHPWKWREDSVESSQRMLAQFEHAEYIRRMFFRDSSKTPELAFTVRLSKLDRATQFYFQIDEPPGFGITAGQEQRSDMKWGGQAKTRIAIATFQDGVAPPDPVDRYGQWALFRLIDTARKGSTLQAQPETELNSVLEIHGKYGHRVQVTIEAEDATRNPFVGDWRRFNCES